MSGEASSSVMDDSTSSSDSSDYSGGEGEDEVLRAIETSAHHIDVVAKNPPPVFTELLELTTYADGFQEWKEVARWIKYEETVEIEGNRWSKPHVSTPKLQGWLQIRNFMQNGLVDLDLDSTGMSMGDILSSITARLVERGHLSEDNSSRLRDLWLQKHRHQFEGPRKAEGNLSAVLKELLVQKLESKATSVRAASKFNEGRGSIDSPTGTHRRHRHHKNKPEIRHQLSTFGDGKVNVALQKKIASNSEAVIILEGVVDFLDKPVSAFVRFTNSVTLGDLPEVDIPTRFLYLFAAPANCVTGSQGIELVTRPAGCQSREVLDQQDENEDEHFESQYLDMGISLATAFTDQNFVLEMYSAQAREDILSALDDYTHGIRVLPREWQGDHKIEPPPKKVNTKLGDELEEIDEDRRMREASGLVRTSRLFGGLLNDLKRKKPFYISDFLHGLHPQCISSFLFLYFACLAPIVAFGALLGEATDSRIATIESLISGLVCGVLFGLFSGQPLILLGSTGPVYVFERILYKMCQDQTWDYLSLRLWIGLWVAAFLILMVAFDASAYVCYITSLLGIPCFRFTEELFATLIAFIFIFNAFKKLMAIRATSIVLDALNCESCNCTTKNLTQVTLENITKTYCEENSGTWDCNGCNEDNSAFLMSVVLFAGSFGISFALKNFRTTGYFPGSIRNFLSNFAVIIGIVVMTAIDYMAGINTPKLEVPDTIKPTWEGRDWLVSHALIFADHILANPWWVDVFLAPVLAILATILIFMDQQITAVIVNRKEHCLIKGGGYHLDLLVLAVTIVLCSVFGLPWFVAATVLSINHLQSLTKESECSVPGDKPQFLGIREQRVTAIAIGLCLGLSILITPILALIPMPVLFGIFLFMGVSSLKGLQFYDRILLLFIPRKHQPEYVFLKYVPLARVHMFTLIQLSSLICLWMIKSNETTSISFPVMLVVLCAIRKMLECIFTKRELRLLDDLLPEAGMNRRGHKHKSKRHNSEAIDPEAEPARLMLKYEDPKKQKRIKELEKELEALYKNKKSSRRSSSLKPKSSKGRTRKTSETRRLSSCSPARSSSRKKKTDLERDLASPQPTFNQVAASKPRCSIYVKKEADAVFTPLHLRTKTVSELTQQLKARLGAEFPDQANVGEIYQRTTGNFLFRLDDEMMESFKSRQVFEVKIETCETDGQKTVDITLIELETAV